MAESDTDATTSVYTIHDCVEVLLILFVCTYGFLGLEYVSVELGTILYRVVMVIVVSYTTYYFQMIRTETILMISLVNVGANWSWKIFI